MNKAFRVFVPVLFSILAFGASVPVAFAAASVTAATGGSAISADTVGGNYTTLTGPVLAESANNQIKDGVITLTAPSGFEFDPSVSATVTITGNTDSTKNINDLPSGTVVTATTTTSQIIFIVRLQSNSSANTLTWGNIRVRPTAGTPLSGNLVLSSTGMVLSAVVDVSLLPANAGALTEVAGAAAALEVAAEATAETAVHAYEVALLTTLGQVTTAEGLKGAADSAVALVLDSTANTAFALRVSNQTTAIASARTTLEAAAALASAKTNAHTALNTALTTYTEANYTAGNWTTLNGFKTNGDTAINAATDLAGISTAQDTATAGMAGVATDLLNAKTSARSALDIALVSHSQTNYTTPNWTALNLFKTNGDTAVDVAGTIGDVTLAQTTATDEMASVKKLEVNQTKTETDSNGNGLATIDATTPEVVITSSTQPVIITVETSNATLDLTGLVDLEKGTGILPQMTITTGSASVEIPDGTTVTAPGWDGIMSAPTAGTTSGTAPAGFSVGDTVIEMGSALQTLNFDQAVKITLTGVTGTVGYRSAGSTVWQTIDTQCTSATNHDNISAPGECYFHNGGDTIIWTYHFTSFGGLNKVVPPSSGHGGGGGIACAAGTAVIEMVEFAGGYRNVSRHSNILPVLSRGSTSRSANVRLSRNQP